MNEMTLQTYMKDDLGPLPFCPGCGHDPLLKALDKALVSLQIPPDKLVVVTDIGCIGLADRYFVTHAFHGLHGRSITYACGLKLARPDLHVIVLMGDGGCGIGGAHLLNVARRNVGITLIVANNFNYGMTGGQQSVTTPTGGRTATTPGGNIEGALDICGTTAAAGAAWVYRGTVYDRDLPERIAEAIRQPGFALLDIWELCTAYYTPRNKFKKREIYQLIESNGYRTGVVRDAPRPEFGARYRETAATAQPPVPMEIEITHASTLERQVGIVVAGSAGGKIKSAATTFAMAAISAGLQATQKDDYPITVLTGHSIAEIILSPTAIEYTAIDAPDYFIVLSDDGLSRSRQRFRALPESCTVIADEALDLPDTGARVLRLPLVKTAKAASRTAMATVALGALLREAEFFPAAAYREAITASQKPGVAKISLRGLEAGLALGAAS